MAKIKVVSPPGVPYVAQLKERDEIHIEEGEEIVLDCITNGARPAAEILWKDENGNVIISNILESIMQEKDVKTFKTTSRLRKKAQQSVSLTCSAFSEQFPQLVSSTKVDIIVKFRPKLLMNVTNDLITEGDTVMIHCPAKAFPKKVTFTWFVNVNQSSGIT